MGFYVDEVASVKRVFEYEGVIESVYIHDPDPVRGYANMTVTFDDGQQMDLPAPKQVVDPKTKKKIDVPGGIFDYEFAPAKGIHWAVRSFIVPIEREGKILRSKRYVFPEPDAKGRMLLKNAMTQDEYLKLDYKEKPTEPVEDF